MQGKIAHLLNRSKQVIQDCALENGALVAANTDNPNYPKDAQNYRFVWPRDAAFVLHAAKLLGIPKLEELFLQWLLERAEGFSETGMLFQRYATNGAKDSESGSQYQPDQAGALLWLLCEKKRGLSSAKMQVISLLADGICRTWTGRHFSETVYDLWEERKISSSRESSFVYSLAACSAGLAHAAQRMSCAPWLKAATEMREVILENARTHYPRTCGKESESDIDASMLGLIWPFAVEKSEQRMLGSLAMIEQKLFSPQGVARYEGDQYDGSIQEGKTGRSGAGAWPLLTFWYTIALSKVGRKEKANELFLRYSGNFKSDIPEQLFADRTRPAVSPLAWSHAMFVVAAQELGHMP